MPWIHNAEDRELNKRMMSGEIPWPRHSLPLKRLVSEEPDGSVTLEFGVLQTTPIEGGTLFDVLLSYRIGEIERYLSEDELLDAGWVVD